MSTNKSKLIKTEKTPNGFRGYFENAKTTVKYKTEVNLYGRVFSGILFIKFKDDTTCHVSLITIPGAKLFDMELTPSRDTVLDCLPQFDKAAVLKTIANNVRVMVMLDNFKGEPESYLEDNFKGIVWLRRTNDEYYEYFQEDKGITKIELYTSKNKKKIGLVADNFVGNLPSKVELRNFNVKLRIKMDKID